METGLQTGSVEYISARFNFFCGGHHGPAVPSVMVTGLGFLQ